MQNQFYFGIYDSILENCLVVQLVSTIDYSNNNWRSFSYPEEIYRVMPELFQGCWEVAPGCWRTKSKLGNESQLTFEEICFLMNSVPAVYSDTIGKMAELNEDDEIAAIAMARA